MFFRCSSRRSNGSISSYFPGGFHVRRSRDRTYLSLEKSFEDAIQVGVSRAVQTLKNVEGVWVANQKCVIKDGKIDEYRVNLKVTFILRD